MDDPDKLIAKIQHFYELLNHTSQSFEDQSLNDPDPFSRCIVVALSSCIKEYKTIFQDFLYTE